LLIKVLIEINFKFRGQISSSATIHYFSQKKPDADQVLKAYKRNAFTT